jgi:tyrosyl-tRNA synthetase
MIPKSPFLCEFIERGFYCQTTNFQELDSILLSNKITAYIGFDCTANSLHIGSLMQIMILRLLQKHNHNVIILLGAGTTKIGDPSGKDEARKILTSQEIFDNLFGIKKTIEKFINPNNKNSTLFVNNNDWLSNLNYLNFISEIGRYFSINRMITFDSVKLRLEREQPLSFLEFNYMILQAYDFYQLWKNYGCRLQIGGSDQWGNIINGVELIRRIAFEKELNENEVFGLTSSLITTSDGKKMGKTLSGAVWLSSDLLSPYDYFQYFRNISDNDVIKFLKLFTELEIEKINNLEKLNGKDTNKAKEILAFEVTKICHGEQDANFALNKSREIFLNRNSLAFEEKIIKIKDNIFNKKLIDILLEADLISSKSEAKRLIEGRGIKLNGNLIEDVNFYITKIGEYKLSLGKKRFYKLKITN